MVEVQEGDTASNQAATVHIHPSSTFVVSCVLYNLGAALCSSQRLN